MQKNVLFSRLAVLQIWCDCAHRWPGLDVADHSYWHLMLVPGTPLIEPPTFYPLCGCSVTHIAHRARKQTRRASKSGCRFYAVNAFALYCMLFATCLKRVTIVQHHLFVKRVSLRRIPALATLLRIHCKTLPQRFETWIRFVVNRALPKFLTTSHLITLAKFLKRSLWWRKLRGRWVREFSVLNASLSLARAEVFGASGPFATSNICEPRSPRFYSAWLFRYRWRYRAAASYQTALLKATKAMELIMRLTIAITRCVVAVDSTAATGNHELKALFWQMERLHFENDQSNAMKWKLFRNLWSSKSCNFFHIIPCNKKKNKETNHACQK